MMSLGNSFHSPWVLWLFLLLPFVIWNYFAQQKKARLAIRFSDVSLLKGLPQSPIQKMRHLLIALRVLALTCLIIAMARPRHGESFEEHTSEGVDIILTLDLSGSMNHLDLIDQKDMAKIGKMDVEKFFKTGQINEYSRLGHAKRVIESFVDSRESDRIGLVAFAGRSMTRCPLTVDYGILVELLRSLGHETIPVQGTAVGDALMTSVQRLKDSKAKSKVVVLLTDGANNAGKIHPEKAAAVAKAMGVKVYTVGVGRKDGKTLWFQQNPFTGEAFWKQTVLQAEEMVDEQSLVNIAEVTGGKFYRANNKGELEKIYQEIDQLEKTEIEMRTFTKYQELFFPWLLLGALLLMIELFLAQTRLMKLP